MKVNEWEEWGKQLESRIATWLKKETKKTSDGYVCKVCGKTLMNRMVYCSIHEFSSIFPNAGGGSVHTFRIPECPNEKCKNHRPSFWDGNLHLDESSDTLRGPAIDY